MTLPSSSPKRRPFWVWVISLFYLLSGTIALFSLFHILGMGVAENLAEELQTLRQQALAWSMYGLIPAVNLTGGVLLLLLHRWAFYAFSLALVLNVGNMLKYFIAERGAVALTSGSSVVGVFLGLAVIVAVCVYTYRLRESGILS
ncbi:MAG: hypothetical protein SWH61_14915 [Thermodesulfobacteriota bacterium]|nr:hypothetical protein [Thermodesulfobacteriota bacterium]